MLSTKAALQLCLRAGVRQCRTVRGCAVLYSTTDTSDKSTVTDDRHRDAEREPLPEWPEGINPHTGEKGGPKGPEPTRYGDWERKGRVSDF